MEYRFKPRRPRGLSPVGATVIISLPRDPCEDSMKQSTALCSMILGVGLSLLGACNSTPGGSRLYDASVDPPVLLDAEIRMETFRRIRGTKQPDLRIIRCRDGRVTGSLHSIRHGRSGEGPIPLEAYYRLWSSDLPEDVFIWDDQPADTDGGYFHVISVGLGRRFHRFSAQNRTNFLGMGTSTDQRAAGRRQRDYAVDRRPRSDPAPPGRTRGWRRREARKDH